MASKTRARGEREPTGRTKAAILLYIADNGERTFTEIREHLQERHNIKSSKDVKLHLADLSSDERLALLEKVTHGSGIANSYRIRSGFNSLKRLHNFLNEYGLVPALMKTKYFVEYTSSKSFDTRMRTNIVRNSLMELTETIHDNRGYEKIKVLLQAAGDDQEKILAWVDRVRASDRDDPLSGSFMAIGDMMREGDIDQLGDIFTGIVRLLASEDFFALMEDLIIPPYQRDMVIAVRRYSPSALDYLLNSSRNNPLFPPNIFLAYAFSEILEAPGENFMAGRLPDIDFAPLRRYSKALPRLTSEPPIGLIARSLFISDMVQGKLAVEEVPGETLKLIFS
ncbi:hypothetical protein [Methanocella sp. MCL-LM]|uniref:hypothetical protein n=1 Tax=Methanocella sp. MCL-LM TaxID=3412035 RepID=UPI003C771307